MSYKEYIVRVFKDKTEWLNKEGKLHRVDGPAIEYADGYKAWYLEGKRHRVDGPAIEYANSDKSWFLEGKSYTEAEFKQKMQVPSCEGKVIEFEGKKYKLVSV